MLTQNINSEYKSDKRCKFSLFIVLVNVRNDYPFENKFRLHFFDTSAQTLATLSWDPIIMYPNKIYCVSNSNIQDFNPPFR